MSLSNLHYYSPNKGIHSGRNIKCDVCVYGGTAAGVIAALQLKKLGYDVVVVEFGRHLGGMTSSGLGATDIGNKHAVGGLSRKFYEDLGQIYYNTDICWLFEPHAAEELFNRYMEEAEIPIYLEQHLESVHKVGNEIKSISMEDGTCYEADMFIDAGYDGDLMAMAGVSYRIGRESNDVHNETYNGVHLGHPSHNFLQYVSPYREEGNPDSGLCPGISDEPVGVVGEGDHRIQAYNFRVCLTDDEAIRVPFPRPENYDPERYTLLARYIKTGVWDALKLSTQMPNRKTDTNNFGAFSSDNIGMNYNWPEGSYEERERIFQDHVTYNLGMLYFLANDPSVPDFVREDASKWGLPSDEFVETSGWPHQLYVRESRRMTSDYIMTEHNVVGKEVVDDSIGLAAYGMDSHNCQRVVLGGRVYNEGNVEIHGFNPYPISYRAVCPKEEQCANLLVPWCLSATHIAFGSIRMEPVGMVLGQSCAYAAALAMEANCPVQRIDVTKLQEQLRDAGQVIDAPGPKPFEPMTPILPADLAARVRLNKQEEPASLQ